MRIKWTLLAVAFASVVPLRAQQKPVQLEPAIAPGIAVQSDLPPQGTAQPLQVPTRRNTLIYDLWTGIPGKTNVDWFYSPYPVSPNTWSKIPRCPAPKHCHGTPSASGKPPHGVL